MREGFTCVNRNMNMKQQAPLNTLLPYQFYLTNYQVNIKVYCVNTHFCFSSLKKQLDFLQRNFMPSSSFGSEKNSFNSQNLQIGVTNTFMVILKFKIKLCPTKMRNVYSLTPFHNICKINYKYLCYKIWHKRGSQIKSKTQKNNKFFLCVSVILKILQGIYRVVQRKVCIKVSSIA